MAEFGSSPCLLDEIATNLELAARMEAAIPDLENRPVGEWRYHGDLAKIGGVIHIWVGDRWMTLEAASRMTFQIQTKPLPR